MSLETISLIGILTLLSVILGGDLFWIGSINPTLEHINDRSLLEVASNVYSQTVRFIPTTFLTTLICALILNIDSTSRSEPYLLRIGLISLIIYLGLFLVTFLPINNAIVSMLSGNGSVSHLRDIQTKSAIIMWIRPLCILVSYWSFLHYALNPKLNA